MPQRIKGYVTRLVPADADGPDRIFIQPEANADLRAVDGKHRAGSGEIILERSLEGHELNEAIELELSDHVNPLERTLTVVSK